jgi:hypothetical protein
MELALQRVQDWSDSQEASGIRPPQSLSTAGL